MNCLNITNATDTLMSTVILSRPVTAVSSKGRRNVENRRRCRCSSRLLLIKCQPVFGSSRAVVTIYYRSTLISAGRGRHRSAMTAAVNVWTTEDTSYCQREQATILNIDQFVLFFFNYFFLAQARQELRSHLCYEFTSECKQLCCVPR